MTFLRTIGGQGGAPGKFSSPQGLDIDDETGNIFVADTGNDRVQVSENAILVSFECLVSENRDFV